MSSPTHQWACQSTWTNLVFTSCLDWGQSQSLFSGSGSSLMHSCHINWWAVSYNVNVKMLDQYHLILLGPTFSTTVMQGHIQQGKCTLVRIPFLWGTIFKTRNAWTTFHSKRGQEQTKYLHIHPDHNHDHKWQSEIIQRICLERN